MERSGQPVVLVLVDFLARITLHRYSCDFCMGTYLLWKYEFTTKLNINKIITILTLKKLEPNKIINNDGNVKSIDLNGTVICLSQLEHLWLTIGLSINFLIKLTDSSLQCGHLNLFTLPPC